ncbi:MAG TPA: YdiU family protein [Gemmatimonadaceae bacterium]|nr:YdiU family protein [Gemmatimonadaceae bacterium]
MKSLTFDNRFVAELPGDPDPSPRPRQVRGAAWSPVSPTPVAAPRLLAHAREVAELVGFTEADVTSPWFASVFGGNALLDGMQPYAANYGGHQFGQWAGQLGDGRAITLGEVLNASGERWELQLKGAGPTPYSRRGDGRAVLRSSIREFLCSEAMHHLGVPTTRALCVVTTGEQVVRDMFYDGNARPEPGAVVCRVAPSFIRFGNFEIHAAREDAATLERLVDFTIARDFRHLAGPVDEVRAAWLREVCERTARLIVHWMRVGFVHGVMNTDNMSILGLTIDYGPYGWLDDFDPTWTPNTTDAAGRRYRFGQQPAIAQWNLVRLAEAVSPLFASAEPLQAALDRYAAVFAAEYEAMLAAKFGFREQGEEERAIAGDALRLLYEADVDYTLFFRALGDLPDVLPDPSLRSGQASDSLTGLLGDVFYDEQARQAHDAALTAWLRRWHDRVSRGGEPAAGERRERMHAVNPRYVLRNYLAQQAIDRAEAGDASLVHTLLDVMRRPYDEQPEHAGLAAKRPEWARHRAGCSMLSCSS